MKRGLLRLTRDQLHELALATEIKKYKKSTVYAKLLSAWLSKQPVVEIFLSENEVDWLNDSIGMPNVQETEGLQGARNAVNNLLLQFKNESKSS
jgi:hypothetical protein